jgi:microcystin-dependent protein
MQTPFLALVVPFGFNFAPKGWAQCSAQLLSIQTNQALFAIVGTTYGGNGIQTFGLPDLRGRVPNGWGQGPGLSNYTLGEISGSNSTTLLANNLPLHTHNLNVNNTAASQVAPQGGILAQGPLVGSSNAQYYNTTAGAQMAANTLANSGSNLPVSILQPYNVVNYCIALQGIFPSRN